MRPLCGVAGGERRNWKEREGTRGDRKQGRGRGERKGVKEGKGKRGIVRM